MNVSETILKEAEIFLKALATGVVLVFVYDWLRIIRRIIPHGNIWIAIEDFLFWMGSAIVIFSMLFRENDGYLRGFSLGGVALGMILYLACLSRFVVKGISFIMNKVLFVLLRPLAWLLKRLKGPIEVVKRKCRKLGRFTKKQLKKAWKTVKIGLCKR